MGDQGVGSFVPVRIVFATYDMKEITFTKGQFLGVAGGGFVVVERFDDLDKDRMWVNLVCGG